MHRYWIKVLISYNFSLSSVNTFTLINANSCLQTHRVHITSHASKNHLSFTSSGYYSHIKRFYMGAFVSSAIRYRLCDETMRQSIQWKPGLQFFTLVLFASKHRCLWHMMSFVAMLSYERLPYIHHSAKDGCMTEWISVSIPVIPLIKSCTWNLSAHVGCLQPLINCKWIHSTVLSSLLAISLVCLMYCGKGGHPQMSSATWKNTMFST